MLCVEIAVRSPNQEPYWSMSVFVSILVCEAAKHVARADTHTNKQTYKHSMVCRCTKLTAVNHINSIMCHAWTDVR